MLIFLLNGDVKLSLFYRWFCFYSQTEIEKALAIQVDDPIPFMQLLAKPDSGITEVRKIIVLLISFVLFRMFVRV